MKKITTYFLFSILIICSIIGFSLVIMSLVNGYKSFEYKTKIKILSEIVRSESAGKSSSKDVFYYRCQDTSGHNYLVNSSDIPNALSNQEYDVILIMNKKTKWNIEGSAPDTLFRYVKKYNKL